MAPPAEDNEVVPQSKEEEEETTKDLGEAVAEADGDGDVEMATATDDKPLEEETEEAEGEQNGTNAGSSKAGDDDEEYREEEEGGGGDDDEDNENKGDASQGSSENAGMAPYQYGQRRYPKKTDSDGKQTMPSIKATQKDRSIQVSTVLKFEKVQLLMEILHLLDLYKAHTQESKAKSWVLLLDALARQPVGRKYKKGGDKSAFKRKVAVALQTWVDWAMAKGYPSPDSVKQATERGKQVGTMPEFVEMVYKIYNESLYDDDDDELYNERETRARESRASTGGGGGHRVITIDDDDVAIAGGGSRRRSAPASAQGAVVAHGGNPHGGVRQLPPRGTKRRWAESGNTYSDDVRDVTTFTSTIDVLAGGDSSSIDAKTKTKIVRRYVDTTLEQARLRNELAHAELSGERARMDDEDMLRLEHLQAKIEACPTGSALMSYYLMIRDRCIARLNRSGDGI